VVVGGGADLYIADRGLFQQYKLQKDDTTTSEERWRVFRSLGLEHFIVTLPLIVVSYPLFRWFGFSVQAKDWPSM